MQELLLTESGLQKLKDELHTLQKVNIPEIKSRMVKAKEDGDLSENNPWIVAREELEATRFRISELKGMIKSAKIVQKQESKSISLGDTVTVEMNGKNITITIVSTLEADPTQQKISEESPLGKALLGKSEKDKVTMSTPSGNQEIKIISKK